MYFMHFKKIYCDVVDLKSLISCYTIMKPNNMIGGMNKLASDFTANSVMMATSSRYVKKGPDSKPAVDADSETQSKSNTINRKLQRKKITNQAPTPQKLSKNQQEQSKPKKRQAIRSNRLNQRARNSAEQEIQEANQGPTPATELKQEAIERNRPKYHRQIKFSSKEKEKSEQNQNHAHTKSINKQSNNKILQDQRHITPSNQQNYSIVPSRSQMKSAKINEKIDHISSPAADKGKRFQRNADKQKQQFVNKRTVNRKSELSVEPQRKHCCQRHTRHVQKSKENLTKMKEQKEIDREERSKKQANRLQQMGQRRRVASKSRQQKFEKSSIDQKSLLKYSSKQKRLPKPPQSKNISVQQKQATSTLYNRYGRQTELSQKKKILQSKPLKDRQETDGFNTRRVVTQGISDKQKKEHRYQTEEGEKPNLLRSKLIYYKLSSYLANLKKSFFTTLVNNVSNSKAQSQNKQIFVHNLGILAKKVDQKNIFYAFKQIKSNYSLTLKEEQKNKQNNQLNQQNIMVVMSCLNSVLQSIKRESWKNLLKVKKETVIARSLKNIQKAHFGQHWKQFKQKLNIGKEGTSQNEKAEIRNIYETCWEIKKREFIGIFHQASKNKEVQESKSDPDPEIIEEVEQEHLENNHPSSQQKTLEEQAHIYNTQKSILLSNFQSLQQQVLKTKQQLNEKQQQNQQLRQIAENIVSENDYIESDVFDNLDTKLPLLLQLYERVKNQQSELVQVAELCSIPTSKNELVEDWRMVIQNSRLKGLINLYEENETRPKKALQDVKAQNEVIKSFLRSYVEQKYLWEWTVKCIST